MTHKKPNDEKVETYSKLPDCGGCTDRRSEGTHAGGTKQHPCPVCTKDHWPFCALKTVEEKLTPAEQLLARHKAEIEENLRLSSHGTVYQFPDTKQKEEKVHSCSLHYCYKGNCPNTSHHEKCKRVPCPATTESPEGWETHEAGEGGWSKWVYPKKQYLFKCCDCGLIHEMEFGVFQQGDKDASGEFDVMPVENQNIRPMFRARRTEETKDNLAVEVNKRLHTIWSSPLRYAKSHLIGFIRKVEAQARQEEQDQIEARMKEWVETRRKEYCKEDVLLEKNKPYDWHGYSHACRDFLSALPTIIRNTPEHEEKNTSNV